MGFGAVAGGHHSGEHLLGGIARKGAVGLSQVDIGLEHHRDGVVANHAMGLVAGEFPHGEFATLLKVLHGGVDEVDGALGLNLRQQRMQGAVGVPEGEDGVDLAAGVDGVNLVVGAAVASVGVAPEVGRGHAVIESGVEAAFLFIGAAFHAQLAEGGLPDAVGTAMGGVEVVVLGGIEVTNGAWDIDTADGHLQLHFLCPFGEHEKRLRIVLVHTHGFKRHGAADGEVQVLVGVPGRTLAPADDKAVLQHNLAAEQHIAVTEVEDDAVIVFLEGIAVVSHPAVGGEFDGGAGTVEQHFVVACLSHLVFVREMALIELLDCLIA